MSLARIKRGDTVKAIAGSERGKTGRVIDILAETGRVRVEGMMVQKRHLKKGRNQTVPEGGIIEKNGTVHASNLMVVCGSCGEVSRTGTRIVNDKKTRFCRKCSQSLD